MCRHAISCQTARVVLLAVFAAKDEKIKVDIIKLYHKDQILEYDLACLWVHQKKRNRIIELSTIFTTEIMGKSKTFYNQVLNMWNIVLLIFNNVSAYFYYLLIITP